MSQASTPSSEQHRPDDRDEERAPILTPPATALVAGVLAVLALMGPGVWSLGVQALMGGSFGVDEIGRVLNLYAAGNLVFAVAALVLARRVVTARPQELQWHDHVARATMVLAGIAAVLSFLGAVLGPLLHG